MLVSRNFVAYVAGSILAMSLSSQALAIEKYTLDTSAQAYEDVDGVFSVKVNANLWSPYGPITRRFGTLYGSMGSTSVTPGVNLTYSGRKGVVTTFTSIKVCNEYYGTTVQCTNKGLNFAVDATTNNKGEDPLLSPISAASKYGVFKFDRFDRLEAKARTLESVGMRPTDIEVFPGSNGNLVYIGVWKPGTGNYRVREDSNWSSFEAGWQYLSSQGYRLIDVERVPNGNDYKFYSVYGEGNDAYVMYSHYWDVFNSNRLQMNANGMRLVDVDINEANGQQHYLGVYRSGSDAHDFYQSDSKSAFFTEFNTNSGQNLDLVDVDLHRNSNGSFKYVGVWRSGSGNGKLALNYSYENFKKHWVKMAEQGYVLLDLDIAAGDATNTFQYYLASYGPKSLSNSGPDLNKIASSIESKYSGITVGMAYALSQNGQMAVRGATGLAQRSPDPSLAMTSDARLNIASVTKMLTAPILMGLLDANGYDEDTPAYLGLPPDLMSLGQGEGFSASSVNVITFGDLMRHRSGLRNGSTTGWTTMRTAVQTGATGPRSYSYENINFGLIRAIIPELWSRVGGPAGPITESNVDQRYLDYVELQVTDLAGIEDVACSPQAGYLEAKTYNFFNSGLAGWTWIPGMSECGGSWGLFLSATEMASYWSTIRYNNDVISPANRQKLLNQGLGIFSQNVTGGPAYGHNGCLDTGDARRSRTCLLELPNNIIFSTIINSDGVSCMSTDPCSLVRQAFNDGFL